MLPTVDCAAEICVIDRKSSSLICVDESKRDKQALISSDKKPCNKNKVLRLTRKFHEE
jgi:hypothetical protein